MNRMDKIRHRGERKKYRYLLIGTLISFALLCFYALQLSVPVILDETTAMANAAWLTGRDWSLAIDAMGGLYFRYVQALMTVPFFAWMKDPEMIYRASMMVQALVHVTIVPVVYVICRRHLNVKSEKLSVLLGMAVCFVPSAALYAFYYRGDLLLYIFPWYVLLAMLEAMRAAEENKRWERILWTALAVLFSVLTYGAHTRGIVVLIALLLCAAMMQLFQKRKSLHWLSLLIMAAVFFVIDSMVGNVLKRALYSVSGLRANALETTNMGAYFNIFSYDSLKDIVMLSLSWLHTLIVSGQGLVMIGSIVFLIVLWKSFDKRVTGMNAAEKTVSYFCGLVFAGYYVVGALFFKGGYLSFRTGAATKRIDRLLYDRYAICGAGMVIFLALYVLCCRREWLKIKGKLICLAAAGGVAFIWLKKILPTAVKYPGYIYNTIILNTFQKVPDPAKILSGQKYSWYGLIDLSLLSLGLMFVILVISGIKRKWMPYVLLGVVLVSDLALIQVNFVKVRKASNDYVLEATETLVDFMQNFEDEVTEEYPYILKSNGASVKIQFYQSQLMEYRMLGKKQEELLNLDNSFVISSHDDIDLTWYEDDYYLFEDFDYDQAEYDVVCVKGEKLAAKMEELGYRMRKYSPQDVKDINNL